MSSRILCIGAKKSLRKRIKEIKEFPRPATVKQLRQFLETFNFYRQFISSVAQNQTKLSSLLDGQKTRGRTPIIWIFKEDEAFKQCKNSLAYATLLLYLELAVEIATDAMGYSHRSNNTAIC